MLTLIILKKYKTNIKNFQKLHGIRKMSCLQVYKFLEQDTIIKKLNTYTNENIYLVFCWKNMIPLLEKNKFDVVIHNVYE
jgi:hypothetical protein